MLLCGLKLCNIEERTDSAKEFLATIYITERNESSLNQIVKLNEGIDLQSVQKSEIKFEPIVIEPLKKYTVHIDCTKNSLDEKNLLEEWRYFGNTFVDSCSLDDNIRIKFHKDDGVGFDNSKLSIISELYFSKM